MPTKELTGNVAAITMRLGGLDTDGFRVVELTGREGLNGLFEYVVQLAADVQEVDLDSVLRSPCTIEIACERGTRYIHGIVRSFERLGEQAHDAYYTARIVPLHWILTKRFGSRIFQAHNCPDMTVPGIIRKVLIDAGIPDDMFRFVLPREMPVREYVVQYRETEYDFIARLMEDEGLACHFEHDADRHTLVIGDASAAFPSNPVCAAATYCDPNGMDRGAESVYAIRERRSIEYGAIGLTDFDFQRPGLDLRTRYPAGPLPPARHSERAAPPMKRNYSSSPAYGPESPEYGGSSSESYGSDSSEYGGAPEHCGQESEPPAYNRNGRRSTGEPYSSSEGGSPAYGGYRSQMGGPSYDGDSPPPTAGYNGGSPPQPGAPGYRGSSAHAGGSSGGPYAAGTEGPSYERPPIEPHDYAPDHGQDRYARQSWDKPRGPAYPAKPGYDRYTPPARPETPYAPAPPETPYAPLPPGPLPPVDYGCAEVKVDYPGEYTPRDEGQRRAQVRFEEHQSAVRVFELTANIRSFMAGYRFTLEYHPVEAFNAEYLVTELIVHARQSQSNAEDADCAGGFRFEARVRAIPAGVSYRPPCCTPRPLVHGAQTALVVGPANDEIYTDDYGRVKVQFHWDAEGLYDEYSSCWIRASQGLAGGQYGMMFLPRVGQEVIVDFLEGNPDRPIITGRVYNSDCMPPYKLPQYKTRSCIRTHSSPGGYGANEIRFEDKKDYEHLLVHAQRDFHLRSRANCFETVGGDRHTWIYGNHYEKVAKKSNLEVCLDRKEKVGGNQSLTVCGDVAEGIHGKHSESCAAFTLKTESGEVVIDAATGITLKVGGNFIKIDATGVYVMGTLINLNGGGSAGIAYLRTPQPPYAPKAAYSTDYGYDMRYSAAPTPPPDGSYPSAPDTPSDYETPDKPTAWVEIEMVDEAGQPWPHEEYELTAPDGTVYNGTLDANGQAHVNVETDGECQIRFPKLDMAAWERQ